MGAVCSSEPPSSALRRETMLSTFRATLDDWRVTRDEADVLYEAFDGADRTRDGFINQLEFLRMLNLKSTAFTKRIFGLFDANGNDEVDFGEFVTMCWSYMCMSKYAMILLAFALYDADDSGDIEASEVRDMLGELQADPNFDMRMVSDLNLDKVSLGDNRKLRITLETFTLFALKYPSVLYPALRVQEDFRQKVGGFGYWTAICSRRAGGRGLDEIKQFQAAIKVAVVSNQGLSEALNIIRDGRLKDQDLAPRKESQRIKMEHSQFFGRGSGLVRQMTRALLGAPQQQREEREGVEPAWGAAGGAATGAEGLGLSRSASSAASRPGRPAGRPAVRARAQ